MKETQLEKIQRMRKENQDILLEENLASLDPQTRARVVEQANNNIDLLEAILGAGED